MPNLAPSIFSEAWALACSKSLNGRDSWHASAAKWEAPVMLVMTDAAGAVERRVFLDLWHGECRAARAGTAEDESAAKFVMTASRESWRQLLAGTLAPLMAVMSGKLRLTKGSLLELVPYAKAAQELVVAAGTIEASWED